MNQPVTCTGCPPHYTLRGNTLQQFMIIIILVEIVAVAGTNLGQTGIALLLSLSGRDQSGSVLDVCWRLPIIILQQMIHNSWENQVWTFQPDRSVTVSAPVLWAFPLLLAAPVVRSCSAEHHHRPIQRNIIVTQQGTGFTETRHIISFHDRLMSLVLYLSCLIDSKSITFSLETTVGNIFCVSLSILISTFHMIVSWWPNTKIFT